MATHEDDFLAQLFVANTHTPVLFFSSAGRVYKLKVYRLPQGMPQSRGKAMINLFPQLADGESITAVLPLPEDETTYDQLSVVFATGRGDYLPVFGVAGTQALSRKSVEDRRE